MFFAGYETTSSAVAFCCHVLAQLPDEKDKLLDAEELARVLPPRH
jgi:cytochrome P450